jgi:hypothetical protein
MATGFFTLFGDEKRAKHLRRNRAICELECGMILISDGLRNRRARPASMFGRAGFVPTGEHLQHPGTYQLFSGDAFCFSHSLDRFDLARSERHLDGGPGRECRFRYVLQFFFKIGQVMGCPEVGQFLDRISFWQFRLFHRFFHSRNRRFSLLVISRAVTGYPLPSGKGITTQNK